MHGTHNIKFICGTLVARHWRVPDYVKKYYINEINTNTTIYFRISKFFTLGKIQQLPILVNKMKNEKEFIKNEMLNK